MQVLHSKRFYHFIQLCLLLVIIFAVFLNYRDRQTIATDIIDRSITIGNSEPSISTFHIFTYSLIGGSDIGSIKFEYCSNTPIFSSPCIPPSGLDTSFTNLASQSGETGFDFDSINSSPNVIVIKRSISSVSVSGQSSYRFDNIINPSSSNTSYYVRISTHSSVDGSGPYSDRGSVVFSINDSILLKAYVPPYLIFCAAQSLGDNCTSIGSSNLNMGTLSASSPSLTTSQIAGASNSVNGYSVYAIGYTLTSGNNIITSLVNPSSSAPGTSQFGINLRGNTSPSIGNEPIGSGTLLPFSDYGIQNKFKYISNDVIAKSAFSSDYNILTVSYIANVDDNQPAGIYTTTITYLAISTF